MTSVAFAIVTARDNKDTHWPLWVQKRNELINTLTEDIPRVLRGEFRSLVTMCCTHEHRDHLGYQMRNVLLGSTLPHGVYATDRRRDLESRDFNFNGTKSFLTTSLPPRSSPYAWPIAAPCSHKNTAIERIIQDEHDIVIMMDDCCLFSLNLVHEAIRICQTGAIAAFRHRKIWHNPDGSLAHADANMTGDEIALDKETRCPFGVWAMPVSVIKELNGFNEDLDGQAADSDLELLVRAKRFCQQKLRKIRIANSTVYEIGHTSPWVNSWNLVNYRSHLPAKELYRTLAGVVKDV